ncbi:MAG: hypothetical protein GY696_30885 [Gammaproteobacteria bacterium]|nr:hypothetical protein [Gammaproteobacteria bacterium]
MDGYGSWGKPSSNAYYYKKKPDGSLHFLGRNIPKEWDFKMVANTYYHPATKNQEAEENQRKG